jgi:low affinity Fe/Cu permease
MEHIMIDAINEGFRRFSKRASEAAGSPRAFITALIILICWAALGPYFQFSNTWQLTINTAASIIPTLMVFLIQNSQNRDFRSLHLKLDELLKDAEGTRSPFIHLEELSEADIQRVARHLLELSGRVPLEGHDSVTPSQHDGGVSS